MNQPQTDRFREKLAEQIRFLERSCALFDDGHEDEAIRLAASLRVLFHDTNRSISPLSHLNLKRGRMLSSSRGHGNWKDYLAEEISVSSTTPVRMKPLLGDSFRECYMQDWWERESVFVCEGKMFPRQKIILSMANKDGGAHVDERLEEYYEILVSGSWAFGITGNLEFNGPAPFPQGILIHPVNGHLALIRQFAHEALRSAKHRKWLPNSL